MGCRAYRLFLSSSLPRPSVMLSPRTMRAPVSAGAQISTELTKYLPQPVRTSPITERRSGPRPVLESTHQWSVLPPETLASLTKFPLPIHDVVLLPG